MATKKTKVKPLNFHTKVAGVSHGNRQGMIAAHCRAGMAVLLRRERHNPHDANAVGVWIEVTQFLFFKSVQQIGYLNQDVAAEIAPLLDAGRKVEAKVSNLTGGTKGKESRGVNLELKAD